MTMENLRNEYIAVVMSAKLLMFCKKNNLPYISADELALREDLTDSFQLGWLIAYTEIWDALID
jgi:hypothetical protein